MESDKKDSKFEIKILAGTVALTPVLLFVTMISMGGGHGTYVLGKLIYPLTMIIAAIKHQITDFAMWLGICQVPIYGLILILGKRLNRLNGTAIFLVVLHLILILFAMKMSQGSSWK